MAISLLEKLKFCAADPEGGLTISRAEAKVLIDALEVAAQCLDVVRGPEPHRTLLRALEKVVQ